MKKQIVFSDYDGTIYITEGDMVKNVKSIAEYRNLGGKFVIVTGRSRMSASNIIKQYHIPYDYLISNNGVVIFDKDGRKLYEQAIMSDITDKIMDHLDKKKNIEIFFYDDDDKIQYNKQKLLKIRIRTFDYKVAQNIEDEINSLFKDEVIAHSSFPGMYYENHDFVIIDVVSKNAGKENAIKKLLEILDIKDDQVVSIGDGRNDIAMIKEYNGYSMKTAKREVKKVASKVFESIADMLEDLKG